MTRPLAKRSVCTMTDTTQVVDFGAPKKVDPKERPPSPVRGGKAPIRPAYEAWLSKLTPGAEFEMVSKDPDGAHSISRLNALRQVAKEFGPTQTPPVTYKIDAVPVVKNKRYRIFGSVVSSAPKEPKPEAKAK